MLDEFDVYEKESKRIRSANKKLLSDFKKWLQERKLSPKTIKNHIENIDFYINEYLLYEEANEAVSGVNTVDNFLGYWFIKKAMWATQSSIKSNASSIKKFYAFLHEKGIIDKEDLEDLKITIRENMDEWLATLRRYDDPDIEDMDEVWGF